MADNTIANSTKITTTEKIIIWILLVVMSLVIIAIAKIILRTPISIPHNSIIVGAQRRDSTLIPYVGFNSLQYIFSVDESNIISNELPKNLGIEPEWSPNGQWIVSSVVERVGDGFSESKIYIMRADGSQRTLVPIPHGGSQPTWSPDGKQIAYYAPGWGAGIYISNVECLLRGETCTPEFRILVEQPGGYKIASPDWSPDGRQIVFSSTKTRHISIISIDGKSPSIDLTPYSSITMDQPRWSPDGTKIVGVCYGKPTTNICVMNKDGSNLTYLTVDTTYTKIHYPVWSPDGQKIAYISRFSNESIAGICWETCPRPTAIFITNANGTGFTHLPFENNVVIEWFTWYP